MHFSFLLVEKKFMTVFPKKKIAKHMHATFVALSDMNMGNTFPAARRIYSANPWTSNWLAAPPFFAS